MDKHLCYSLYDLHFNFLMVVSGEYCSVVLFVHFRVVNNLAFCSKTFILLIQCHNQTLYYDVLYKLTTWQHLLKNPTIITTSYVLLCKGQNIS